jgi:hypothetical protein
MKQEKRFIDVSPVHTLTIETTNRAFGQYDAIHDNIILSIPEEYVSNESVKAYDTLKKRWGTYQLQNLVLSIIEHETIHQILHHEISVISCLMLDNPINGELLETIRDKEEWFKNETKTLEK